jgi:hypothetical protein
MLMNALSMHRLQLLAMASLEQCINDFAIKLQAV